LSRTTNPGLTGIIWLREPNKTALVTKSGISDLPETYGFYGILEKSNF
jgi:hypothetical protein